MCLTRSSMLFGSCGFDAGGLRGIYPAPLMGKNRYESKRHENTTNKVTLFALAGLRRDRESEPKSPASSSAHLGYRSDFIGTGNLTLCGLFLFFGDDSVDAPKLHKRRGRFVWIRV